jgi:hypothetical protein
VEGYGISLGRKEGRKEGRREQDMEAKKGGVMTTDRVNNHDVSNNHPAKKDVEGA